MPKIPGLSGKKYDDFFPFPLLGIDEVGTGCIAGPVYAAGVVLVKDHAVREGLWKAGVRDSKEVGEHSRRRMSDSIKQASVFSAVESAHPREIEEFGLYAVLDNLFSKIISAFRSQWPDGGIVLIDGRPRERLAFPHEAVVKGDQKSLTIGAASILAKVARDQFMEDLADAYPGYGWEINHGYPTREHLNALTKLGATDAHRANTRPVRALIGGTSSPAVASDRSLSQRASEGLLRG